MKAAIVLCFALTSTMLTRPVLATDCASKALEALEAGAPEQAVPALRKGGRRGKVLCQYILGMWSLSGLGVEQDPVAGSRWLRAASHGGLPAAQANLGVLYASGIGVKQDDERAARWYRKAAESGDPLAQVSLGAASFHGAGAEKDLVEAYKWTSLAAAQQNERARSNLSVISAQLTPAQLQQARQEVAAFRPKRSSNRAAWSRREVLRLMGVRGAPHEYNRLFD